MDSPLLAISIHKNVEPCKVLEAALGDLSVEFYNVQEMSEAKDLISQYQPHLVFVELLMWRRLHNEIVKMAGAADQHFNVVVVGSLPDIEEYVAAIEDGAFEYIAPPFSHDALTRVVHSAAMDARDRRESWARVAMARMAV